MKKLGRKAIVIAAVLLVLAIVSGTAAYGYFFSGQTIENNRIKAGTIKLQLNGGAAVIPMNLDNGVNDIMPGDSGTVGGYKISNIGDKHASLYVGVTPNGEYDSNLADVVLASFWLDVDNTTTWTAGDSYFIPNGQYVQWATGDTAAIPAEAFFNMSEWRGSLCNTMNVEVGDLGYLQFSYLFPGDAVETVEAPLMGKEINFNLVIQLDQYHPAEHMTKVTASTHPGASWDAYSGGFLVESGTLVLNQEIWLPSGMYDIVFTDGAWTYTKEDVDLRTQNFAPFETT